MTHINQLLELPVGSTIVVHGEPELGYRDPYEVFVLHPPVSNGFHRYWREVESGLSLIDSSMVEHLNSNITRSLGFYRLVDVEKTVDREALREIYDEAQNQPGSTDREVLDKLLDGLFDILDLDPTPATQAEVTSVETVITPSRKDSSA